MGFNTLPGKEQTFRVVPGSLGKTIAMLRQGKMLELPQQAAEEG